MAFLLTHSALKAYQNFYMKNARISIALLKKWRTGYCSSQKFVYASQPWLDEHGNTVSPQRKLHSSTVNHSDFKDISPKESDIIQSSKRRRNKLLNQMDLNHMLNNNDSENIEMDRETYDKEISKSHRQAYLSRRFTNRSLRDIKGEEFERKTFTEESEDSPHQDKDKDESPVIAAVDDSDVFGTLTDEYRNRRYEGDDLLILEEEDKELILPRGRRHTPIWYGNQMKKLVKHRKLKEAIEMLETRMLTEDRVHPTEYNYNVLIGACGRAGYTKKAFKLYNDMKRRGLSPSDVTYTALINACAQSPWPKTDGLSRLNKLRALLDAKSVKLNAISYRSLIKAYAKCGDILSAFQTFDEMIFAKHPAVTDSFNALLMACIEEKDSGFRMALQVWQQMHARSIKPATQTYNLLLRAVRDCGIGDVETANHLLLRSRGQMYTKKKKKVNMISSGITDDRTLDIADDVQKNIEQKEDVSTLKTMDISDDGDRANQNDLEEPNWWKQNSKENDSLVAMDSQDDRLKDSGSGYLTGIGIPSGLPNLLDNSPVIANVESLGDCSSPEARLALIGGVHGVLAKMKHHNAKPDIKTCTLFLDSVPMTAKAEKELMVAMATAGIQPDVDFCNAIIRRRTKRNDLNGAKDILSVIHKSALYPNLRTFVNLACACFKQEDGLKLLKDVKVRQLV
ncbi:pentatricopeptide repeat-containing protein 1, mitochondrial-like isoform X2 [Ptychodera flava]|uniref:pentatricopeptide repeat-containing protein 1, mitochondrial-like isoform X2 n=1 Tax=Ptychodera flava TaxID=63121 RepID=UPI00396A3976